MIVTVQRFLGRLVVLVLVMTSLVGATRPLHAQAVQEPQRTERAAVAEGGGGEASLVVPDLSVVEFRGVNGRTLLMGGLGICALGLLFGLLTFTQLKAM